MLAEVRSVVRCPPLLAAIALAGFACSSPERQGGAVLAEGVPRSGNVVELRGVSVDRFERDRLSSRAAIEQARIDREKGVIEGEHVAIEVYPREREDRQAAAVIRAPRARGVIGDRRAELEGGVVLTDRDGRVLRTERVLYDAADDTARAPGRVVMEGDNFRAEGASMIARRALETIDVAGPISSTVTPQRSLGSR